MADYTKEDNEVANRNNSEQEEYANLADVRFMTERGKQTGELYYWATMTYEHPKILVESRGARVSHISAGRDHVIVVTDEGGGRARFLPDIPETKEPEDKEVILNDLAALELVSDGIARAAVGGAHTLVSTSQHGEVYAWGRGEQGQLGLPHALGSPSPQLLRTLDGKNIIEIAAGESHSAALADNGGLYTWGSNVDGQCGIGKGVPFSTILTPRYVPSFLGVRISKVSCGARFTAAVTEEGEIWAWGEGNAGQLGCGRHTKKMVPQLAAGVDKTSDGAGFADVACGWCHCLGLSRSGEVFAWGLNAHGQLGLGDLKARHYPEKLLVVKSKVVGGKGKGNNNNNVVESKEAGGSKNDDLETAVAPTIGKSNDILSFSQIAAGRNYSAALTMAGSMFAWGSQFKGHGGGDNHVLSPKPVELTKGKNFSFVACGEGHIVAFAPTGVRNISPNAGPSDGGTDLTIYVDGVWECEEILVRFYANVPVEGQENEKEEDDAELEMGEIAEVQTGFYDAETSSVKCSTPSWFPAETVTVEITVNGFDYTANRCTFIYYNTPEIMDVAPTSGPITGGTTIQIHGKDFVETDSLAVRLRTVVSEEEATKTETFVVPARFVSDTCIECNTAAINAVEDHVAFVSVTVDVALNGIDFTDAGVTFDMLNIKLSGCAPQCALRQGGQEIVISGTGLCEVDEPILVKFGFVDGRQRIVVGELVPSKNSSFTGLKCICPPLDGTAGPELKTELNLFAFHQDPENVVWSQGYGNEPLTVQVSMNGGVDFIADELPFNAYCGFYNYFQFSSNIVNAMGGTVVNITQPIPGEPEEVAAAVPVDEGKMGEGEGKEATGGEEVEVAAEETGEKEEEAVPPPTEEPVVADEVINNFNSPQATNGKMPYAPWIFSCPDTKVRFIGGGQDLIAQLDYVPEKNCYTCVAPAMLGSAEWLNYTMENINCKEPGSLEEVEGGEVGEPTGDNGEEAPVPKPKGRTLKKSTVDVHIAVDGTSFEKIGSIDYIPPPVMKTVEPASEANSEMEMTLNGDLRHCGLSDGFVVGIRVTHLGTGEEYDTDGTVSNNTITFVMPEIDHEAGQEICKVEVSVDRLNYTEWNVCKLSLTPPEEEEGDENA